MKLGAMASGTCLICGSDTLGSNIGYGCKAMFDKAVFVCLREHDECSLNYNWCIKVEVYMRIFNAWYEETLTKHNGDINKMFKSDFNKSFFPSVYKFYKETGHVSKKQLDIVLSKLQWVSPDHDGVVDEEISDKKNEYLESFKQEHFNEIIEITRNMWKQKSSEDKATRLAKKICAGS